MNREVQNTVTGALGFAAWIYFTNKTPEYAVQIALGCLLALICFAGRDTIIEILKNWRGQ